MASIHPCCDGYCASGTGPAPQACHPRCTPGLPPAGYQPEPLGSGLRRPSQDLTPLLQTWLAAVESKGRAAGAPPLSQHDVAACARLVRDLTPLLHTWFAASTGASSGAPPNKSTPRPSPRGPAPPPGTPAPAPKTLNGAKEGLPQRSTGLNPRPPLLEPASPEWASQGAIESLLENPLGAGLVPSAAAYNGNNSNKGPSDLLYEPWGAPRAASLKSAVLPELIHAGSQSLSLSQSLTQSQPHWGAWGFEEAGALATQGSISSAFAPPGPAEPASKAWPSNAETYGDFIQQDAQQDYQDAQHVHRPQQQQQQQQQKQHQEEEGEEGGQQGHQERRNNNPDKKLRRLIANRASAKRSRQRRQDRLEELEVLAVRLRVERAEGQRKLAEAQAQMKKCQEENEELQARAKRLRASLDARGHATGSARGSGAGQPPACSPPQQPSALPSTSSPATEGCQDSPSHACKDEPFSSDGGHSHGGNDGCTDGSTPSDRTAPTASSSQGTPSGSEEDKAPFGMEEPLDSDFMAYLR